MVHPKTLELLPQHPVFEVLQSKPRDLGLFEGLLAGHAEILGQDALEHPEKYEEQARPLLQEIAGGKKEFTAEERKLLDQATLDFATYVAPKPKEEKPKQLTPKLDPRVEQLEPPPVPGVDVPDTEAPAYWWLR